MIEPAHPGLSVTQQCELLGLPRSSYYHVPAPEADENLRLMRVFRANHITGWRRESKLVGRPDFVFPKLHLASWMTTLGIDMAGSLSCEAR